MKFNGLCLISMLLVSSLNVVSGHECLHLEPMKGFQMEKFLGSWYVLKTLANDRCLVYDFYTQKIENLIEYEAKSHYSHFFGALELNTSLPSRMKFTHFKLDYSTNPKKKTSFVVIDTNYESYAGLYICEKSSTGFRHYVAVMSRSVNLEKEIINNLLLRIYDGHVPLAKFELANVDHKDCNHEDITKNSNGQNVINEDGIVYISIKWMPNVEPAP